MNFAHQEVLWLLLVLPPGLAVFFWWAWRERQRLMTQFIQARLLPGLISGVSTTRRKIRLTCLVAAVTCAILALARPQWGSTWEQAKQKGLDIVVAIDTSKSMLAEDITPNRLTRAKLAALDLMQQAKSDRLGLVAFAGGAFLQCPLTIDDNAFRQSVESLDVNIIPQGGTALAEAITTALTAFKEGDNFKVLVIFTDGEDNDEGALAAAEAAAKEGMKIFTIGIGTAEGELLRVRDAKGRTDYIRDGEGNVVKSHLNEALLQQIAGATDGGFYLPLRGAKTIEALYEKGLAPLPKSEGQEKLVKRYHERYHWPLGLAIILLLVEMLLPERKRERKQRPPVLSETSRVGLLCVLIGLPNFATASPSSALREYEAGKYDAALREYQQSLEKKKDDPRLQFNAGAAAYRDGKLDEAMKHFSEATSATNLKLQEQAYYNLGNTFYRAGEALPDPQKRIESWEGAVKQFDNAIKLNTNNADAKFNHEFVKKKLEELKQQQQQQNKDDQKKDDNKQDQQDKQDQQNKDQQQKDGQQKQNQDKQDQQQPKQDQQNQQKKPDDKQSQDKQDQQKPEQQKEEQQKKASKDSQQKDEPEKQAGEPSQLVPAHAMTPQEAKQLLDAQKGDEQVLQFRPQGEPKHQGKTLKDW